MYFSVDDLRVGVRERQNPSWCNWLPGIWENVNYVGCP